MTILVTGGAGFVGSTFVNEWILSLDEPVINIDILNYAGNLANLTKLKNNQNHNFVKGSISDKRLVAKLLSRYKPRAVINFAAETHVDNSIVCPEHYIKTNVIGTSRLLETIRVYWNQLPDQEKHCFRFLNVSTDEVYGSLAADAPPFSESDRFQPNNPYSASKASSDHLVRAFYQTYGLPVLTTNCSNNYGPKQFPEKLVPLVINNALAGKPLPIYGSGQQIRDWIFVSDHCSAIRTVLANGTPGEVYNIGAFNEKSNIEVVHTICDMLENFCPPGRNSKISSYRDLITFVQDRLGHDQRYAINADKIKQKLGWRPTETFETGMLKTVDWYVNHQLWTKQVTSIGENQSIEKRYK